MHFLVQVCSFLRVFVNQLNIKILGVLSPNGEQSNFTLLSGCTT